MRIDLRASRSCSRRAATNALDSMYRTPAVSALEARALALRFAPIGVNQLGGGSSRKADVRPPFRGVTRLERWANHSGRDELVEAAPSAFCHRARRDKFRDDATMSRDRNTLAGLNPPDVPAQIVLQFADPCGGQRQIIATCGHIRQASLSLATAKYPLAARKR